MQGGWFSRTVALIDYMRIAENHPTPKLGKKTIILFAHENLAFRASDFLWRVRRKTLAVVILQQGFPTQLSAKKCAS